MFFKKIPFLFLNFIYMVLAAGHLLIREAAEDTVLEIPKPHGQVGTTTIPVPKGLQVIVDMVGLRTFSFISIPHTVI
jgi:hypothetical protein